MAENAQFARSVRIIGVSFAGGALAGVIASTMAVLPSGDWFMMIGAVPSLASAFGIMAAMIGAVCASFPVKGP